LKEKEGGLKGMALLRKARKEENWQKKNWGEKERLFESELGAEVRTPQK